MSERRTAGPDVSALENDARDAAIGYMRRHRPEFLYSHDDTKYRPSRREVSRCALHWRMGEQGHVVVFRNLPAKEGVRRADAFDMRYRIEAPDGVEVTTIRMVGQDCPVEDPLALFVEQVLPRIDQTIAEVRSGDADGLVQD